MHDDFVQTPPSLMSEKSYMYNQFPCQNQVAQNSDLCVPSSYANSFSHRDAQRNRPSFSMPFQNIEHFSRLPRRYRDTQSNHQTFSVPN